MNSIAPGHRLKIEGNLVKEYKHPAPISSDSIPFIENSREWKAKNFKQLKISWIDRILSQISSCYAQKIERLNLQYMTSQLKSRYDDLRSRISEPTDSDRVELPLLKGICIDLEKRAKEGITGLQLRTLETGLNFLHDHAAVNKYLIRTSFQRHHLNVSEEEISKIESKFCSGNNSWRNDKQKTSIRNDILKVFDRLLSKGLISGDFFINYPEERFPFIECLLERGVNPKLFLEHTYEEMEKVLKWQLNPQEPIADFLKCVNQYDTVQEALAAWTTKESKETIVKWSKQPSGPTNSLYSVKALLSLYGNQDIFNSAMDTTIHIAADALKNKSWDFNAIMAFSAFRRGKIAEWQGDRKDQVDYFGFPRGGPLRVSMSEYNESMVTKLSGCYEPLRLALYKIHTEQLLSPPTLEIPSPMPEFFYAKSLFTNKGFDSRQYKDAIGAFYITIKGLPIELTSLMPAYYGHDQIYHTPTKNIEAILGECAEIYKTAIKEDNIKELVPLLGKLFWLICQAKPWRRGDPSIAEIIVRSILLSKDLKASPWKEGIAPWIEASKYIDGNAFGRDFASLFQTELVNCNQK